MVHGVRERVDVDRGQDVQEECVVKPCSSRLKNLVVRQSPIRLEGCHCKLKGRSKLRSGRCCRARGIKFARGNSFAASKLGMSSQTGLAVVLLGYRDGDALS